MTAEPYANDTPAGPVQGDYSCCTDDVLLTAFTNSIGELGPDDFAIQAMKAEIEKRRLIVH